MSEERMRRFKNCHACWGSTDGPNCKIMEKWLGPMPTWKPDFTPEEEAEYDRQEAERYEKMDSGFPPDCPLEHAPIPETEMMAAYNCPQKVFTEKDFPRDIYQVIRYIYPHLRSDVGDKP